MRVFRPVPAPRRAFSLFDLLVILAVLAILLGLLLPAVQKVRAAAARSQSTNNLKQIGIAALSFHDANTRFPPAYGKAGGQEGSVFFHLLPYLEQDNVYKAKAYDTAIRTFIPPNDPTNGPNKPLTSYAANRSLFGAEGIQLNQVTKGTSNTVMFAERYAERNGKWSGKDCAIDGTKGGVDFDLRPPGKEGNFAHAFSPGVCMLGLADGSVRSYAQGTRDTTFRWACDPKSDAPAPPDW